MQKVTLSLNRNLLEKLSSKAEKTMSEYVRDLLKKEELALREEYEISSEVESLRGILPPSNEDPKEQVRKAYLKRFEKKYNA